MGSLIRKVLATDDRKVFADENEGILNNLKKKFNLATADLMN
jgi:hypothetical protein